MTNKRDYLGECNDQGVPLEDFRLAFCVRCFQAECSRSKFGTTKFEQRVQTWEERLFHAPQLPKTDPRWQQISAKKFLVLSSGPAPAVREWIDPQTLDVPAPPAQIQPAPLPVVKPPPVAAKPPEPPPPVKVEPPPPVIQKEEPAPEPKPVQPKQNLFVNTPYAGPVMIGNSPSPPGVPEKDPWAGPAPLKSGEKVVTRGAKIKLGRT